MKKTHAEIIPQNIMMLTAASMSGCITFTSVWSAKYVGRAYSLFIPISALLVFPLILWILHIVEGTPKCSILDVLDKGMGKITSKVICIVYYFINIALSAALLNLFTQVLKTHFLPNTPYWVIMTVIVLMCTIFVSSGIDIVGMLIVFLVVITITDFFTSFGMSFFGQFKIENLFPVFDTSLQNFIVACLYWTGNACESILLLVILTASMPVSEKRISWVWKGVIIWTFSNLMAATIFIGIVPVEVLWGITSSGTHVAELIHIGEFLRGVEILVLASYQIRAVMKTTIYLYCLQQTAIKIFERKKPKLFLSLSAVFIFIPSIWINSYNKAYFLAVFLYQYVLLPFSVFLLFIASISAVIIGKRKKAVKTS